MAIRISKYTKLGLLIVFSLTVLIWGLSYLKGNDVFKQLDYYHVYYDRVDGLVPSNKVTLNGYQIGQVKEINFASDYSGKLIVTLSIDAEFRLPVNSVAQIITSDIMGTRSVAILLSKEKEFYQSNDTIPGTVESDLKEQVSMQVLPLKNKAEELLSTVDSAITVLTVILNEDARENLSASFANINQTIKNIEGTTADLQEIVSSEKESVKNIVSNIDEITSTFKRNTNEFENTIKNLSSFSDSLSQISVSPLLNNVAQASEQILLTLEKLNSSESTAGLILNDDKLYMSLNMLSENLGVLIGDIKQHPKRYLQFSAFDLGKEVYINTKDDASDKNIVFKIHLVSSENKINTKNEIFKDLSDVEEYNAGGVYTYLIGATSIYSEIEKIHAEVKAKFPESTVVAFKNGRLIKLKKALKQIR